MIKSAAEHRAAQSLVVPHGGRAELLVPLVVVREAHEALVPLGGNGVALERHLA